MRVLPLLLLCTILTKSKVIIQDANIASISRDDIGMIFYLALRNNDECDYTITTRMVKCVEEVDVNDKDCETMQLIGGHMGMLKKKCSKNITLIYPNLYLHNRKGYCIVEMRFTSEDNQILEKKTNISFNTLVTKGHSVPGVLTGYYTRSQVSTCSTVDQDPLRNCDPVDCHIKYVGTRSYFNKVWRRCQKVPQCVYDWQKELPDVGYTPVTNRCVDLERSIRKSELGPLENKFSEMGSESNKYSTLMTNINCHYGKLDNTTGTCICNEGWTSSHFEKEPSLFAFHMCNIEKPSWYDTNRSKVTFVAFFMSLAAVAVTMIVVLMSFILYHLFKCLKSLEGKKTTCECSDVEQGKDKKGKPQPPPPAPPAKQTSGKGSSTSKPDTSKESLPKGKSATKGASPKPSPDTSISSVKSK